MIESRDIKHIVCVERIKQLEEENKNLNEKVRFLEECLDRKEKVNKNLREENSKLRKDAEDIAMCGVKFRIENEELKSKVKEQYYIIQQYEEGFASGSWHGEDEE